MKPPAQFLLPIALWAAMVGANATASAAHDPLPLRPQPVVKEGKSGDGPALDPFLPEAGRNTGCAVLIVPADGAKSGDAGSEVTPLTTWLNEQGVAAFLLRYPVAPDDRGAAVADINRAVQYLRAHAAEFTISPQRIGVLGLVTGAEWASDAAYNHPLAARSDSTDLVERVSSRPDFVALVGGSVAPSEVGAAAPPAFLAGSSDDDGLPGMIELWTKLRAARVSVDAHFFPKASASAELAPDDPAAASWPGMFQAWVRFSGFLTEAPRLPVEGLVYLDGHPLPHGYVIFTPMGFVGVGPVIGRVLNSTAGIPAGQFSIPAGQGPVAGRYKIDVRQNMARWLSNSFSGDLVNARGQPTAEQAYFGHHRILAPSLADQRSYTKVHPADRDDYTIEFKPSAEASRDLTIAVFSK